MYVTMNRFKIKPEYADDYLKVWERVQSKLQVSDVAGFMEFKFFRMDSSKKEYVLFSSYAEWESKEKFMDWVHSEHFKNVHKTSGGNRHMYIDHPKLECFEVI
ncbi:antibiotic biosynthesis monooxygenase family protein [Serratia sp. C2(1)]|uniref:antibiotic biosynthesis monooxygenase family protein n=1 Tax=Serratia sp. C2(1) TaxID=3117679 RepID=UPI002ED6572D|nr:antibiotic biosynthesis monooxygenase [Serratia sp. C2(1)]